MRTETLRRVDYDDAATLKAAMTATSADDDGDEYCDSDGDEYCDDDGDSEG